MEPRTDLGGRGGVGFGLKRNFPKHTSRQVHLFVKKKTETDSEAFHLKSVLKKRQWTSNFNYSECMKLIVFWERTGIAQLVQGLVTGWTVRG